MSYDIPLEHWHKLVQMFISLLMMWLLLPFCSQLATTAVFQMMGRILPDFLWSLVSSDPFSSDPWFILIWSLAHPDPNLILILKLILHPDLILILILILLIILGSSFMSSKIREIKRKVSKPLYNTAYLVRTKRQMSLMDIGKCKNKKQFQVFDLQQNMKRET